MTTHNITDATHRASCAECAATWAELDQISAEAARLPQLSPSRDLWSGIESRLTSPGSAARSTPRWYRGQSFRLAMAASLLIAVTATVTWRLASTPPQASLIVTLPNATPEESAFHQASFTESVSTIDREIAALQLIVEERSAELDPRTVQVLTENLRVIDHAIAESRAALSRDPASEFLAAQFTRAYTSKLTLLRDAATLPTGI